MLPTKREQFVHSWIESGSKTEAYKQVYSTDNMKAGTVHKRASELSKMPDVVDRFQELTEAAQERLGTTVDYVDGLLRSAYAKALELDQPSAMVAAANALAKLHGLNAEKGDNKELVTIYNQVVVADRSMIPPMPTVGDAFQTL